MGLGCGHFARLFHVMPDPGLDPPKRGLVPVVEVRAVWVLLPARVDFVEDAAPTEIEKNLHIRTEMVPAADAGDDVVPFDVPPKMREIELRIGRPEGAAAIYRRIVRRIVKPRAQLRAHRIHVRREHTQQRPEILPDRFGAERPAARMIGRRCERQFFRHKNRAVIVEVHRSKLLLLVGMLEFRRYQRIHTLGISQPVSHFRFLREPGDS